MSFDGKTIVVGVTGGIAAYKTCELVSSLKKQGADVFVVMTENAQQFVSKLTFETLSNHRVVSDMWDRDFEWEVEHISLAKRADLFLIAPCTANVIGKLANGIADDFLTTTAMAMTCPILLAPAMNTAMLNSAAFLENEMTLKKRGVHFVYGGAGRLACGDVGAGRMAEPSELLQSAAEILFPRNDYAGKTVLITAGATSEPIDPVRFITNRSSGKMGCALADAVVRRGGKVILIHGNMRVQPQNACCKIAVETTQQMFDAVMAHLQDADIIIKAAAPADYKVAECAKQKIKSPTLILNLEKNPDIAAAVGKQKGDRKLIIFSAETENLQKNAGEKLKKKGADMVVANDITVPGAGFDVDTNIVQLISPHKTENIDILSKTDLADVLLDRILEL